MSSSKDECERIMRHNGSLEILKIVQPERSLVKYGKEIKQAARPNESYLTQTVLNRSFKSYNDEKPLRNQLNKFIVQWTNGEVDTGDILSGVYRDGILYDIEDEEALDMDTRKESFDTNRIGLYYAIKRKVKNKSIGYELYPVDRDRSMTIREFKQELQKPLMRDDDGCVFDLPRSDGYAVLLTKKKKAYVI